MVAWIRTPAGALVVVLVVGLAAPPAASVGPDAGITGVVTDDGTGQPLADICVTALDENTMATGTSAPSGPDGRYEITGLPQGAYQVSFRDCSAIPMYRAEAHLDRPLDVWSMRTEVVWVPAGTTVAVDASLELGGAIIAGFTWAHTGTAATGVCIASRPADSPEFLIQEPRWAWCPEQGASPGPAVLGGLVAGPHLLDLFAIGWSAHFGWYGGPTHELATRVPVVAGERTTIDIAVEPRPYLPSLGLDAPPASYRFDDVEDGSVHAPAIGALVHLGVMAGTDRHTFGPGRPFTRGQAASTVVRALALTGARPPAADDAFDDDEGSVHEPSLDALAAAGILLGSGERVAAPTEPLSRAQTAALVTRAYEYRTGTLLRSTSDRFVDDGTSPLEPRIDRAATAGLVQGVAEGTFAPGSPIDRAQAATVLARLLALLESDLVGGAS